MSNTKSSNFVFVFSSAAITDAYTGPPVTRALILLQFLVVDGCRFFVLLPTAFLLRRLKLNNIMYS